MKKIITTLLLLLFTFNTHFAQDKKFEFGAYGNILFQHMDYGLNRKASVKGSLPDSRQVIDLERLVFELDYKITKDIFLGAEIEFEHGGTGTAMELEYEEFGEYEMEVEKGGEIVLEQFHITKEFSKELSLRAGHFIVAVGQINDRHRPQGYFSTVRSEGESAILPVTWHETGLEIFGDLFNFKYRLQLVNGLDASGFSSESWIKEGHQKTFELTRATNMAVAARLEYAGIKGLTFGGSLYRGNSTENLAKPDLMSAINGLVSLNSLHATYITRNIIARGNFLYGTLSNAAEISRINSSQSKNIQFPRTPVAKAAMTWAAEAGYNVFSFADNLTGRLFTFLRYEYYNSMQEVDPSVFADKRFKRNVLTFGLNYLPLPELIIKMDYSMRKIDNGNYNNENTFGLSVSFAGTFFSI
jgi:hypothetical protein